jgi:transcriptional regulator with XRE-family HTH domain
MANAPKDPLDHEPEAVAWARNQARLTKSDVARKLQVSLSLISMIESGDRNASPAMIRKLAQLFGCPEADLERDHGKPGTRLAVVCVECSEVWAPGHRCPTRAARDAA